MILPMLAAFAIGLITVLQSGLHKNMLMGNGILPVVALNAVIAFIISMLLFFAQKYAWITLPESFSSHGVFQIKKWWYLIPGICGFLIVIGFPLAISYMGAAQVFIIAIAGQCVGSLLWDVFIEQNSPTLLKSVGVLFTLVGAFLTTLK